RERGDDLDHVQKRVVKACRRLPSPCRHLRWDEHSREQQGQQEQDVVEPGPDVPNAFAAIVQELHPLGWLGQRELLLVQLSTEDAGARLPLVLNAHQSPMLWIDIEEQTVVDGERLG